MYFVTSALLFSNAFKIAFALSMFEIFSLLEFVLQEAVFEIFFSVVFPELVSIFLELFWVQETSVKAEINPTVNIFLFILFKIKN